MNRQRIRYGLLVLIAGALAGLPLAPAAAQAGPAKNGTTGNETARLVKVDPGKPGKEGPCAGLQKPTDPKNPPVGKAKSNGAVASKDKAASENKGKGKGGDKGKRVGVLVCGDIAKISGRHRLTAVVLKTPKGPVTVRVTPDTLVYKNDVKVPRKALKVGVPVAIKAEVLKNGTISAGAIILL